MIKANLERQIFIRNSKRYSENRSKSNQMSKKDSTDLETDSSNEIKDSESKNKGTDTKDDAEIVKPIKICPFCKEELLDSSSRSENPKKLCKCISDHIKMRSEEPPQLKLSLHHFAKVKTQE